MEDLKINIESISSGSFKFQIFEKGEYGKSPYSVSGIAEPVQKGTFEYKTFGPEGCEIVNLQGDATNESNELMALSLRDIGFEYLFFKVLKGTPKVTHYAKNYKSDENFDYYFVPLKDHTTDDGR